MDSAPRCILVNVLLNVCMWNEALSLVIIQVHWTWVESTRQLALASTNLTWNWTGEPDNKFFCIYVPDCHQLFADVHVVQSDNDFTVLSMGWRITIRLVLDTATVLWNCWITAILQFSVRSPSCCFGFRRTHWPLPWHAPCGLFCTYSQTHMNSRQPCW